MTAQQRFRITIAVVAVRSLLPILSRTRPGDLLIAAAPE